MPDERPEGKGSFAVDGVEETLAEALRSVERLEHAPANEVAGEGGEAPADEDPVGEVVDLDEPAEGDDEPATLRAQVAALEEELRQRELLLEESTRRGRETMERLKEASDRALRAAADLDNFRKRAAREREEVQKFGVEGLLRDLLPVLDNFDRALDHASACTDVASFAEGVSMTRKLFEDTLGRHGVKSFRAVGESFDPRIHEAVQGVESHEHPANVVVQEIVRGFFLNDRLVRPSMVVVSRGPGPGATSPGAPEGAAEGPATPGETGDDEGGAA